MRFKQFLKEQVHLENYNTIINDIIDMIIKICKEDEFDIEYSYDILKGNLTTQDKYRIKFSIVLHFVDKITKLGGAIIKDDEGIVEIFLDEKRYKLLKSDDKVTKNDLRKTLFHEFTHIKDPYVRKIKKENSIKRQSNKDKIFKLISYLGNDSELRKFYGHDPIEIKAIISEYVYDYISELDETNEYKKIISEYDVKGLEEFYYNNLKKIDIDRLKSYSNFFNNSKLIKFIILAIQKTMNRKIEDLKFEKEMNEI